MKVELGEGHGETSMPHPGIERNEWRVRKRMDGAYWRRWFEDNRRRPDIPLPAHVALEPRLHALLVRSLQRFQLGESSEGSLARQAHNIAELDADTRIAIGLFVREEGRHARELAHLLAALGAPTLRKHWSETLFRRGRRLFGFRTKMLVIGGAEIVGAATYALLAERVPEPIARFCATLAEDEARHLDFLADWFHSMGDPLAAITLAGAASAAITLSLWDHRALFARVGITPAMYVRRCFREVAQRSGMQTSARAELSGRATEAARAMRPA
jgi:hypothetical protein